MRILDIESFPFHLHSFHFPFCRADATFQKSVCSLTHLERAPFFIHSILFLYARRRSGETHSVYACLLASVAAPTA